MGSAVTGLTTDQLSTITQEVFVECKSVLGGVTTWSTAQLGILALLAKNNGLAASISDSDLSKLKSILVGFSTSDLSTIVFTSTTSISTLGTLTTWSTDQVKI